MKKLVLQVGYGGLGDHLFYSHIPQIAAKKGYKTYISNKSPYRSLETRELVWGLNPYISGFTDEQGVTAEFDGLLEGVNIFDMVMLVLDLDDGIRGHKPELYYKPNSIELLNGSNIYDPNYCTPAGHPASGMVQRFFVKNNIALDFQMKTIFKSSKIDCSKILQSKSLKHYCDLIFSCDNFYCLASGGSVLAGALGKKANVLKTSKFKKMFCCIDFHKYIEVDKI